MKASLSIRRASIPAFFAMLLLLFALILGIYAGAADTVTPYQRYDSTTSALALSKKTYASTSVENGVQTIRKTAGGDELSAASFTPTSPTVAFEFRLGAPAEEKLLPMEIRLRNDNKNTYTFFAIGASGAMSLRTGGDVSYSLGTLGAGDWVTLSFIITLGSGDASAMTVDAYVDGYLAYEDIPFTATGTVSASSKLSRYIYFGSNAAGAILIDDLTISPATVPQIEEVKGSVAHLRGNADDVADQTMLHPYGSNTVLPTKAEMNRTGYDFAGWNTAADGTGEFVTELYSNEHDARVLYAVWEAKRYTVTWNVDGTITSEQIPYGTVPVFSGSTDKAATASTAYRFIGWDNGTIKAYVLPKVTENVEYTAIYEETPSYKVYYHRTYEGVNPTSGITAVVQSHAEMVPVTSGDNTYIAHRVLSKSSANDTYFQVGFSSNDPYIVMSFSLSTEGTGITGNLQYKGVVTAEDGSTSQSTVSGLLSLSGNTVKAGSTVLGTLESGKWLDLTMIIDLTNHLQTIYVNGDSTPMVKDRAYSTSSAVGARSMRFYFAKGVAADTSLLIDNWAIYEGSVIRELPDPETYVADAEKDLLVSSDLDGSVAMKLNVDAMLTGGLSAKLRSEIPAPVSYLGVTYVPIAPLAEAFGYTVTGEDALTLTGKHTITGLLNDSVVYKDGVVYEPINRIIRYDGTVMVSLADAAALLELSLYADTMGLILFSENERIAGIERKQDLDLLVSLMEAFIFDTPTGEQILSQMNSHNAMAHPRLLASADQFAAARAAYEASEESVLKTWVTQLVSTASSSLTRANPTYGYDSGNRMGTSTDYITNWSFAWQMTSDMKYPERALSWIYALSLFDDWCPGHSLNNADTSQGVALAYDWMYDAWNTADYWTEEKITTLLGADAVAAFLKNEDGTLDVSRFIEDTLYYYAIASAIGSYNKTMNQSNSHGTFGRYSWTGTENNWNAVCNTGYLMSAIALAGLDTLLTENTIPTLVSPVFSAAAEVNTPGESKPELLWSTAYSTETANTSTTYTDEITWLLTKIMNSIRIGVRCYAPDGSYAESSGYWSYGTNNLFRLCETLYTVTGTTYGLMETAGIDRTLYFAMNIESSDNLSWNYHDSGTSNMPTIHAAFAGQYFGDSNLSALRYASIVSGKKSVSLFDVLYYNAQMNAATGNLPLDYLMEGIDTSTMRTSWESGAIFAGLHGGYNSVNHGDMDAGTFIYDANGIRWFTELGSDYYNLPGYFGKGEAGASWKYYRKVSEGQNTVIIVSDPSLPYGQNPTATASVTAHSSHAGRVYTVLDMKDVYGANATSAERAMLLLRSSNTLVLQDEISFSDPTSLYWIGHTTRDLSIADDGRTAYLTASAGGKTYTLRASLLSEDESLSFTVIDPYTLLLPNTAANVEMEYDRSSFKRLAIYAENVTEFNVSVVLEMIESPDAPVGYEQMPIADWASISAPVKITVDMGGAVTETTLTQGDRFTVLGEESVFVSSDGELYRSGEVITPAEDLTLTEVTVDLLYGASIRAVQGKSGLRFESEIPYSLLTAASDAGISLVAGTLIVPTDRLTSAFTMAALDAADIAYINLYTSNPSERDGAAYWYASITNLRQKNYTRSFSAISYVTVTAGAVSYTVYSGYDPEDNARSVYQVASLLYATDSAAYSADTLAIVRSFIDGVLELKSDDATRSFRIVNSYMDALDPSKITLTYTSPYTVSYSNATKKLTVKNGGGISTILLDGIAYTSGWASDESGELTVTYYFGGESASESTTPDIFDDSFGDIFGT